MIVTGVSFPARSQELWQLQKPRLYSGQKEDKNRKGGTDRFSFRAEVTSFWPGCGEMGTLIYCWWEGCKLLYKHFGKYLGISM